MRRRDVFVFGGAIAVALAIPPFLRRRASRDLAFSDLSGMPGFRRLVRGNLSVATNPFSGLQTPQESAATARLPKRLCPEVFGARMDPDLLPVAVFSDYYCPYCAVFETRLVNRRDEGAPIDLIFRELPLLGERSRWAAKVALSAGMQVDHNAIHLDMMQRVLRPGLVGVRDLADRHNLDAARLMADAQSDVIADKVEDGLALGRALGIPGTPALMVGRTLVIGALPEAELAQVIALERAEGFRGCA